MTLDKENKKLEKKMVEMKQEFERKIELGLEEQDKIAKEKDNSYINLLNERDKLNEKLKASEGNLQKSLKEKELM
ncbi:MAG: hypothetical protein DSY42_08610 [Aquifex sp.]|nr:MAG: hypothetical protein DSY42_08610 [Aquifex sp.]